MVKKWENELKRALESIKIREMVETDGILYKQAQNIIVNKLGIFWNFREMGPKVAFSWTKMKYTLNFSSTRIFAQFFYRGWNLGLDYNEINNFRSRYLFF